MGRKHAIIAKWQEQFLDSLAREVRTTKTDGATAKHGRLPHTTGRTAKAKTARSCALECRFSGLLCVLCVDLWQSLVAYRVSVLYLCCLCCQDTWPVPSHVRFDHLLKSWNVLLPQSCFVRFPQKSAHTPERCLFVASVCVFCDFNLSGSLR